MFAAATLIPIGLILYSGDLLCIVGAVIFLLMGSWVIRFLYLKIPHASLLEMQRPPSEGGN